MITKFKIYESRVNEPKIGDFVVCSEDIINSDDFLAYNVGQLVCIKKDILGDTYFVKYDNIPRNKEILSNNFYEKDDYLYNIKISKFATKIIKINNKEYINVSSFDESVIVFSSKSKEECETFIAARKYNI